MQLERLIYFHHNLTWDLPELFYEANFVNGPCLIDHLLT